MNNAIASWDNDYARHARAIALLHADFPNSSPSHPNQQWQDQASSIQTGLNRLSSHLYYLESHLSLSPAEVSRRRTLLEGLKGQISSDGGSAAGVGIGARGESSTVAALRQQDDMIDKIANGVDGIKKRTKIINEEVGSQLRMVNEIDDNVDLTNQELEEVTRRTKRFRKENRKSVWRLHLIIVGLSVFLFLLILMGLF